jgi:hypothetical protein
MPTKYVGFTGGIGQDGLTGEYAFRPPDLVREEGGIEKFRMIPKSSRGAAWIRVAAIADVPRFGW